MLNLCGALDDGQLLELGALGNRRRWRKRDILFRAGDPMSAFFKITSGVVAVVSRTIDDGRRQIVALRIAGDCVGYLETEGRYTFEGYALTDVEACAFSRRRFDALARQYPVLAAATVEALASAQKQTARSVTAIGQLRSTERVAYFFSDLHALYRERFGDSESFPLALSRSEIASYLGLTLETVSRSVGKLRKRGLIAFAGDQVTVLDVEALCEFASFEP